MSEQTEPQRGRAPGVCTYCDEWVPDGVIVGEIERDAGAAYTLVRHLEHVGLPKPASANRPRTWTG
jgi:hypothetical protein